MAEHERPDVQRPFVASEAHECKERAEDELRQLPERLVWAVLAVAAELHIIRKEKRRSR
ncbi:hypothetical protein OG548_14405 [Streptomyces sp. NBC_01356]|uniref:hypothetical protein n=1 Tax=Streptomyces sp. NBC_01356 TaxID=2903836 RepID=UPI002E378189|nr:hypothetical protein [Streptomyces sp. NBC_01356]